MIIVRLFVTFFKIGLLGFGGGMAILPLIYQGALALSGMDAETFADLFAISQATPGPIAVNAATFVGFQVAGVGGALAATIGVACPSFILVALVEKLLSKYRQNRYIDGAFSGIRPATVGMIAAATVFLSKTSLFQVDVDMSMGLMEVLASIDWLPVVIAVVTLVLAAKFHVGTVKLILIMAVVGAVFCSGVL